MEDLLALKQLKDHGFLSEEEFNRRRLEIIDRMTNTMAGGGAPAAVAAPAPTPQMAGGSPGVPRMQPAAATMAPMPTLAPQVAGIGAGAVGLGASTTSSSLGYGTVGASRTVENAQQMMQQQMSMMTNTQPVMPKGDVVSLQNPNLSTPYVDGAAPTIFSWEFFHAASNNNVKRLSELLAAGVDVNQVDPDSGNTALIIAGAKGQKHALYYLVDQDADIDAQNKRGQTSLHALVNNRYTTLAIWLVKHGADINIEDNRGFTPYDMALPWLQKEMKEAVYGRKRQVQARGSKQTGVVDMTAEAVHHKLQNVKEGSAAAAQLMGAIPTNPNLAANPYGVSQVNPFATIGPGGMSPGMGTMGPGMGMGTMGAGAGMGTMAGMGGMGAGAGGMGGMGAGGMGGMGAGAGMGTMAGMGAMGGMPGAGAGGAQMSTMAGMGTISPVGSSNRATIGPSGGAGTISGRGTISGALLSDPGGTVVNATRTDAAANSKQEVMKVYLKNGAYKSMVITSTTKAGDVCQMIAEKLGMAEYAYTFDLIDSQKGTERRLDPSVNVFRVKENWPLILGKTGNETEKHCKLIVVPKRGTSDKVQMMYRKAMYGK